MDSNDNYSKIDDIAQFIVINLGVLEYHIDFFEMVNKVEDRIVKIIRTINSKYIRDGYGVPFEIIGDTCKYLKRGKTYEAYKQLSIPLTINSYEFEKNVSKEILKKLGCNPEDINITQKSIDGGIDYWSVLRLNNSVRCLNQEFLIVGQVKGYQIGSPIGVTHIREFIGAVETAIKGGDIFSDNISAYAPIIKHFVTSSDYTDEAIKVARLNGIRLFNRRHLIEMNII